MGNYTIVVQNVPAITRTEWGKRKSATEGLQTVGEADTG